MISPVVGWFCLKPSLLRSNDYDLYRSAYKRLQHNPDIFRSLLIQQTKAPENWKSLGINVGNPHANNTIIKVCSPYCNPCAETHPKLEEIIRDNKNVNLKVIFTGGSGTQEDRTSIIRHLLAIAAQYDTLTTERALADWYQSPKKDYNAFASKYPIKGELKDLDVQIESMSKWCKETGIVHTPTIFVNGYKLPDNYELGELNFIFQVSDFTIFNDFV